MELSARYLIGIDLGTTNSVVAYIDTREPATASSIHVFDVPQLVAPGELRALPSLPSFLYFPAEEEMPAEALTLPWDEHPPAITGVLAREHGALIPGRQVFSAKSWLCHEQVDRRARILPQGAEPPQPMLSPVEASARYLIHLRDAWNHALASEDGSLRFEKQEIVLTVPASFDAEARELTVEAARLAGLQNFTLLEEPLAAFYAWIAATFANSQIALRDGELILICDIGGGTTDFSLVRTRFIDNEVQFERTAIGEHLLLGGDNLDLALSRRLEERIGGAKLNVRQRQALRRACCAAKERMLSEAETDRLPITILGGGRSVVGQMLSGELRRDDVLELLTSGFLPLTAANDLPGAGAPRLGQLKAGMRELGLPYADDPAITRHLAAFLTQAAAAMQLQADESEASTPQAPMARPDAILFNGGFCTPAIVRERILEAIAGWFPEAGTDWRPKMLPSEAMGSAVAKGAAYYGRVRHGAGLRIRAGSARTYYIGLRSEHLEAVCVLPVGIDEGTTLPLTDREFAVLANRPVSFALYSSRVRHEAHGQVAALEREPVHRHAPLVTLLRYGKKLREIELAVRLRVTFTELGTLELWCESLNSPHQWRLQFELRGYEQPRWNAAQNGPPEAPVAAVAGPAVLSIVDEASMAAVAGPIRRVFGELVDGVEDTQVTPTTLVSQLETGLGLKRDRWPLGVIRGASDVLVEMAAGRKKSPVHEVRWLNLSGFCMRPGFGAPGDAARINQILKLYREGAIFPGELQSEVEWLVLWRRLAGGLNASQQQEFYRKHLALLRAGAKKKNRGRLNRQVEYETWRLLASLEHLPGATRAALGKELLAKIAEEPEDSVWLGALARMGARIPLYGPLSCVVTAQTAAQWLHTLLELPMLTPEVAYAIMQLGRRTGDSAREIDDQLLREAFAKLGAAGLGEDAVQVLQNQVVPHRSDAVRMFGESLPVDLHLTSSANCLLPVMGLIPDSEATAVRRS
jgi:hypothetical protein